MKTIQIELDDVENEVLERLIKLGIFSNEQEAFKIALLKYAFDLENPETDELRNRLQERMAALKRPALSPANLKEGDCK